MKHFGLYLKSGFEIIHHRDVPQSLTEAPLPPGWEGRINFFIEKKLIRKKFDLNRTKR